MFCDTHDVVRGNPAYPVKDAECLEEVPGDEVCRVGSIL